MKRGFSLPELVIAVALVAILASVAVPGFSQALHRSRRIEAVSMLMQVQLAQERWRSSHPTYAVDLRTLGIDVGGLQHYRVAILEGGAHRYTAVATAIGTQAGDAACTTLGVTQAGGALAMHSSGNAPVDQCWRR